MVYESQLLNRGDFFLLYLYFNFQNKIFFSSDSWCILINNEWRLTQSYILILFKNNEYIVSDITF
jgi:hypothetical protein